MRGSVSPVASALLCACLLILLRFLINAGASQMFVWLTAGFVTLAGVNVILGLWQTFQWSRALKIMKTPTGVFGNAEHPSSHQLELSGLKFSNPDGDGIPLGAVNGKIIFYDGPGHISVRAPTNSGKTESFSANILFALGPHRNIIATAKGGELAWLCAQHRRALGQNVIIINPWEIG